MVVMPVIAVESNSRFYLLYLVPEHGSRRYYSTRPPHEAVPSYPQPKLVEYPRPRCACLPLPIAKTLRTA
jgi:hypothetical protein